MDWINRFLKRKKEKEQPPKKIVYRATLEPTPHPRYNIDKKEVDRIKKLMNF